MKIFFTVVKSNISTVGRRRSWGEHKDAVLCYLVGNIERQAKFHLLTFQARVSRHVVAVIYC